MTAERAIEKLKELKTAGSNLIPSCGERAYVMTEAIAMAINALERDVPKKVEIRKWNPALCPSCGYELSDSLGDGYYRHYYHLKRCPNDECCQRLDWSENDD